MPQATKIHESNRDGEWEREPIEANKVIKYDEHFLSIRLWLRDLFTWLMLRAIDKYPDPMGLLCHSTFFYRFFIDHVTSFIHSFILYSVFVSIEFVLFTYLFYSSKTPIGWLYFKRWVKRKIWFLFQIWIFFLILCCCFNPRMRMYFFWCNDRVGDFLGHAITKFNLFPLFTKSLFLLKMCS